MEVEDQVGVEPFNVVKMLRQQDDDVKIELLIVVEDVIIIDNL